MHEHTHNRSLAALLEGAAEFLARTSNGQSLITVTRARLSEDGRRAIVFLSVLPPQKAKAALDFANRNHSELKDFLKERTIMGRLPRIEFALETEGGANTPL